MESNAYFPELAKNVTIRSNAKKGQFLEATTDIPPGVIVCSERGVSITISPSRCNFCVSQDVPMNSTICSNCQASQICGLANEIERGFREKLRNFGLLELALRVVLSYPVEEIVDVLQGFSSNKKFTVKTSKKRQFELVANLQTSEEGEIKGRDFDKLLDDLIVCLEKQNSDWISLSDYAKKFKEAIRFVLVRLPNNAHSIFDVDQISQVHDMHPSAKELAWVLHREVKRTIDGQLATHQVHPPPQPLALGLFPISSLMNHSCRPNTFIPLET